MAIPWSRNDYAPTEHLRADMLNSLANDDRDWKGDVNGGGFRLSHVILSGSGGFENYLSPLQVTPGSDGGSYTQYDQTGPVVGGNPTYVVRWIAGKNATAETGSNAGSDYEIRRYSDAGLLLGTPFAINRATGITTLGPQHWTGPIDGGGQTLSNITIAGVVTNPMTAVGDLIVGGAAGAPGKLAVGTNGQTLVADSTVAGVGMKWATTNPLTTAGDLIVRDASAAARLAVGTDGQVLTVDTSLGVKLKWATAAASATYLLDGVVKGTRPKFDVITGANVALTMVDDPGNNQVKLTIASTGGSGGGGSQTPWISDIEGAGFALNNAGRIGIGVAAPAMRLEVNGSGWFQGIENSSGKGVRISFDPNTSQGDVMSFDYGTATMKPFSLRGSPVVLSGGNVGVNVVDPQAQFHVYSAQLGYCAVFAGAAPSMYFCPLAGFPNPGQNPAQSDAAMFAMATAFGHYGLQQGDFAIITQTRVGAANGNRIVFGHPSDNVGNYTFGFYYDHGKVGIGTGAPDAGLQVVGDGLHVWNPVGLEGTLYLGSTRTAGRVWYDNNNARLWLDVNGLNQLSVNNNGRIGIGTASPWSQLSLVGPNPTTPDTASQFRIGEQSNNPDYRLAIGFYIDQGDGRYKGVIQAWHASVGSSLLLNPSFGNVGIGRANPSYSLDVNGDVNTTGVFRVNGVALTGGGGGITVQNVVTGSRASGSVYLNSTGKAMFVTVMSTLPAGIGMQAFSDASSAPATLVSTNQNTGSGSAFIPISFWVLPGSYYKVTIGGGGILNFWVEWN